MTTMVILPLLSNTSLSRSLLTFISPLDLSMVKFSLLEKIK
jgi:hypothetical protein